MWLNGRNSGGGDALSFRPVMSVKQSAWYPSVAGIYSERVGVRPEDHVWNARRTRSWLVYVEDCHLALISE